MSDTEQGDDMLAPLLRTDMQRIRRALHETPGDDTDLRIAIECIRTVLAHLCGNVQQNHASIIRSISVLCTTVSLQKRLHGGDSGLHAALHEAARLVLEKREEEIGA